VLTCGRDSRSVGVVASPVYAVGSTIRGDDLGVVYVGSSDASFYAVTAETGKVKWRLDVDGAVATSAAIDADGRLYFATDTGVVYQVAENATERSGTES
jgi:outer membrane protein assembly factor BamB